MKKVIKKVFQILLILFFLISVAFAQVNYQQRIEDEFNKVIVKGSQTFIGWEEGIKEEYGFKLILIKAKAHVIDQKDDGQYVLVLTGLEFIAQCINKDGQKVSVVRERLIEIIADKEGNIVDVRMYTEGPLKVIDGWDGKREL